MNRLHYFSHFSKTLAPNRFRRPHDAVLLFAMFPYSSAAAVVPTGSSNGQHMFMAQYLVESCGFDQEKAADVSKQLRRIKSRQQPDSVLAFLRSYGFDDQAVKNFIVFFPRCLLLDVEKSLAPKFRVFEDLGLSRSVAAHLIRSNPLVLKSRSETIVSKIQFWLRLIGSEVFVRKFLKNNQWFLGYSIPKRVRPNLEILQECGVTGQKLSSILKHHPNIVMQTTDSLKSLVSRVENLGVPRTSGMFHWTLWALYLVNPKRFKMQMDLFKGFGWSEEDFVAAFRKCPTFLTKSRKTLQKKMEFFVNEAGCASSDVMINPIMLAFSLEKRLIPRYKILTFLKSKGCYKSACKLSTFMIYSEKEFLERRRRSSGYGRRRTARVGSAMDDQSRRRPDEKTFLQMYILRYKDECPDLIELYPSLKKT